MIHTFYIHTSPLLERKVEAKTVLDSLGFFNAVQKGFIFLCRLKGLV